MGMCSEWHYTTREIGGWRHDNEPVGRVVMSPYANPQMPIHDGKRGQLKLPKTVMNGTTMWSCDTELCTNGVEATKC